MKCNIGNTRNSSTTYGNWIYTTVMGITLLFVDEHRQ